ncbi:MAG: L-rhamnose mutarotase [Acidimicrobiaceae bacterium]|nr:L-rhamnose mutarotase [Acidimicrobiaceae bacterium]
MTPDHIPTSSRTMPGWIWVRPSIRPRSMPSNPSIAMWRTTSVCVISGQVKSAHPSFMLTGSPRLGDVYGGGGEGSMQRVCLTFRLVSGREDEYRRRHVEVWPELEEAIRAVGIVSSIVYVAEDTVVVLVEHPSDIEGALERLGATEVNARWSEYFADVMATQPEQADEVWRLR